PGRLPGRSALPLLFHLLVPLGDNYSGAVARKEAGSATSQDLKPEAVLTRITSKLVVSIDTTLRCIYGGTNMIITLGTLVVWLIIAALVGIVGEVLARRRTPDGLLGALIVGFIAIFLIVGVFHFAIAGEPTVAGVPLISSVIAAAILVAL